MEKISAVLIVKNEVRTIKRCLRSLLGVDEVVVLDTGSTDGTPDFARKLGAKVTSVGPSVPFHFANARNAAHDLAANDWIVAIDADEVLRAGMMRRIRKAIAESQGATAFAVTFTDRGMVTTKKKLYRRDFWKWQYRVHEQLMPLGTDTREGEVASVVFEHLPEPNKTLRRGQNIELLRITIRENPEYIRAYKHLGQELMIEKLYLEAIPHLAEFVEKTQEGPLEKSEVMMRVGQCYGELKQYEDACRWFEMATQTDPRRREPLYHGGRYMMLKNPMTYGDLVMAIDFLKRCVAIPVKAKLGSNLDQPSVWGTEPARMLVCCEDELRKASPLK